MHRYTGVRFGRLLQAQRYTVKGFNYLTYLFQPVSLVLHYCTACLSLSVCLSALLSLSLYLSLALSHSLGFFVSLCHCLSLCLVSFLLPISQSWYISCNLGTTFFKVNYLLTCLPSFPSFQYVLLLFIPHFFLPSFFPSISPFWFQSFIIYIQNFRLRTFVIF